jgi:hypothetical protein
MFIMSLETSEPARPEETFARLQYLHEHGFLRCTTNKQTATMPSPFGHFARLPDMQTANRQMNARSSARSWSYRTTHRHIPNIPQQ